MNEDIERARQEAVRQMRVEFALQEVRDASEALDRANEDYLAALRHAADVGATHYEMREVER